MLENQANIFEKVKIIFIFRKITPNSFCRSDIGPKAIGNTWGVIRHSFYPPRCIWNIFSKIGLSSWSKGLFFSFWRLRRLENEAFHGLQNMVVASSIWAFWGHYYCERNFIHSLTTSPFQILIKCFVFEKQFKKPKSCSFFEGFMYKTCLITKQKVLKKSK